MNNKKNVTIVIEKRTDAIHLYIQAIVNEWKKSGIEFNLIIIDNTLSKNKLIKIFIEAFNLIHIILRVNKNDIVLFSDPLSFNLLGALFLKNKKYLIFYHYEKDPFFYKYIPYLSFNRMLENVDGIMCISKFSRQQLQNLNINTKICEVIYGGVNHQVFKPFTSNAPAYDYILSIGSEEPRKNMKNILKAFQILNRDFPNLKLLKVGKVNPKNRAQTIEYVRKFDLEQSVIFTDYVTEDVLSAIYSQAKVLLFPSLLEGFGMPLIEAMACGCPIITSNRDPMQELAGENYPTVDPLNPDEIAKACKAIIEDEIFRKTIVQKSIMRANDFNWESTARKTHEFMIA
jgi:glycosyltransferase involved in cell wall biosynthesis